MDPLIIFFGLAVGILVGLTGIGGGSLMTPLLILFGGVPPVTAIGTDLAYGAVTKTLGGWRHWRSGTVDLGVTGWMAVGSVPGSLVGVWVIERLHNAYGDGFDSALLLGVAVALGVVALSVLARSLFVRKLDERESVPLDRRAKSSAVGIGAVLGLLVGATSVGSGALIGLALILVFRLTPHRVVGTDVLHAAVLLWAASLGHIVSGNVDFALMGTILIGSLPGVWIGSWLVTRVPANGLRPALGCVLLASALGVASKAGAELPPALLVVVPLAAGALALLVHRRRARHISPAVRANPEASAA